MFPPRFWHHSASALLQLLKIDTDKPQRSPIKPDIHHNSPQTPKTCFIHNQVVGPPLLTFAPPEKTSKTMSESTVSSRAQEKDRSSKEKSPILERMGL
jgi:hypothetical protein